MNRAEQIERLQGETFDLCVIGAGASGAGCALDASLRGLKVALIDRGDFAGETSSKSTKLVHGGVRYLEMAFKKMDWGQLRQVKHGLRERRTVLANAPHLARPLGILTPVFSWWEGLYYSIGLRLYDWFAGNSGMPASRWLGKTEALAMVPGMSPDIHSAVLYYDGQMDDARYALALVQSAAHEGAAVANYVEALAFKADISGKLMALEVSDRCGTAANTFEINAKVFLNCTGPFADSLRLMANPALSLRIRPSKGAHLVLDSSVLGGNTALLVPKTRDGRMVFAIPFEGKTLVGTTDESCQDLRQEPVLLEREAVFLLGAVQPFFSKTLGLSDIRAGFGGIRPLLAPEEDTGKSTGAMLRDHAVEFDRTSGLVSLLGGKWTSYRLMASDAVDKVCDILGNKSRCATELYRLTGYTPIGKQLLEALKEKSGLDDDICQHLCASYGSQALAVAELAESDPNLKSRILPNFPYLCAEIIFAVQNEMAVRLRDFMARRIRLETSDWNACEQAVPVVAHYMAVALGWAPEEKACQMEEYLNQLGAWRMA
jgi:glycerol-3-phosphate dehydrogenase